MTDDEAERQAILDACAERAVARSPNRIPKDALARTAAIYATAIARSVDQKGVSRKQAS